MRVNPKELNALLRKMAQQAGYTVTNGGPTTSQLRFLTHSTNLIFK